MDEYTILKTTRGQQILGFVFILVILAAPLIGVFGDGAPTAERFVAAFYDSRFYYSTNLMTILTFCVAYDITVPRYFMCRKYAKFFAITFVVFLISECIVSYINSKMGWKFVFNGTGLIVVLIKLLSNILVVFVAVGFRALQANTELKKEVLERRNFQIQAELEQLKSQYPTLEITTDNRQAAADAGMVIVAVKPWLVKPVVEELQMNENQIYVSIAAGVDFAQLESAFSTLESNFPEKDIMLVEFGYYHKWQPASVEFNYESTYPISEAGQKAFTDALIQKLESHPKVTGIFWWWMEANEYGLNWNTQRVTDNWYNAGLFDNETGKALSALSSLKDFIGTTGIDGIYNEPVTGERSRIYNLVGQRLSAPQHGINIINGKKVIWK